MRNGDKVKKVLDALVEVSQGKDKESFEELREFMAGENITWEKRTERFATIMAFMCNISAASDSLAGIVEEQIARIRRMNALKRLKGLAKDKEPIEV